MRNRSKLLLGALTAAIILAAAVGTASARRLEVTNQGFRAAWTRMIFSGGGSPLVTCPVTLEGSFHSRTISKVVEQLIGLITKAIVGEPVSCTGGRARTNTETLPWHLRYTSFLGALPNITDINVRIVGAVFEVNVLGAQCKYSTTEVNPATGDITRNTTTGVATAIIAGGRGFRTTNGFPCPTEGGLTGTTASLTVLNSATLITVRLVA